MDEAQAADIQRSLGKLESALKSVQDGQTNHAGDDKIQFGQIRDEMHRGFVGINERLAVVEGLGDMVEGHGSAIAELEQSDEKRRLKEAAGERDRIWIKAIGCLVLLLVIDHFTGQKFLPSLGEIVRAAIIK